MVARTRARQNDCGSSWNVLEAWQLEVQGWGDGELQSQVGEGHGRAARCPCGPDQEPCFLPRAQPCRACFTRGIFLISHWLPRPQADSRPERWETRQLLGPPWTCRSQSWSGRPVPRRWGAPAQHRAEVDPRDPVRARHSAPSPRVGAWGWGPGTQAPALLSTSLAAGQAGQTRD